MIKNFNKTIAFRVDSSSFIGIGHVKRCISIAAELNLLGYKCIFISSEFEGSNFKDIIENKHELVILKSQIKIPKEIDNTSLWLCREWIDDAQETLTILQQKNCNSVFVDHYGIPIEWESYIKNFNINVMAIDDIDRAHNVNLFIDYSFWKLRGEVQKNIINKSECKFLLGKDYIPLDSNYHNYKIKNKNFANPVILISLGGFDNEELGIKIIKILEECKNINIKQVIVVTDNKNQLSIKSTIQKSRLSFEIHVSPNNLGFLYSRSDICFGASGVSAYERLFFEIPQLIFVKAKNQNDTAQNFQKKKFSNKVDNFSFQNIKKHVEIFLDENKLEKIHSNISGIINLEGAKNIATSINKIVI